MAGCLDSRSTASFSDNASKSTSRAWNAFERREIKLSMPSSDRANSSKICALLMPCFDNEISSNGSPLASNHALASRLDFDEPDVYNLIIQSPLNETIIYPYCFSANTTHVFNANNVHKSYGDLLTTPFYYPNNNLTHSDTYDNKDTLMLYDWSFSRLETLTNIVLFVKKWTVEAKAMTYNN